MLKIGFGKCEYDCCVYVRSLDDGSNIFLSREFDMKNLGDAKKILGMEILRDRSAKKLWLSQKSYVEDVLKRFDMRRSKPVSTPLANHFKLSLEQCPKTEVEQQAMSKIPYASAVGCLMYVMVCTRPDLAQAVSQVCKFMSKPGKQHWEAIKWILRYLRGTSDRGIMFSREQTVPSVVGYVDSDYAGDLDDCRSTTGYVYIGGWTHMLEVISSVYSCDVHD